MKLSPRNLVLLAVAVGVTLAGVWMLRAKPLSAEELVRQQVDKMVSAVGDRDLATLMEPVSERFSGPAGMRKNELKSFLAAQLLRGKFVSVLARELRVEVFSDTSAKVSGTFLFGRSGSPPGKSVKSLEDLKATLQGSEVGAWDIAGDLEKEPDGVWRFVRATYSRSELPVE